MKACDYEDPPPEALQGGVAGVQDASEVGEALLNLVGDLSRAMVLLSELDAGGFEAITPRLKAVTAVLANLPTKPVSQKGARPDRRPVGFRVEPRRRARKP